VVRRGKGVVIYQPYNFLTLEETKRLSSGRIAAEFITTVEYDTYATVAKRRSWSGGSTSSSGCKGRAGRSTSG
jgi:hypothetical protein